MNVWKRILPVVGVMGAIVSVAVPRAFADSFSFAVSGNTQINFTSPNDNFWGDYQTPADALGTMSQVGVEAPFVNGQLSLGGLSFTLPSGSTITSASLELILPTTSVEGSFVATNVTSETFPQPDRIIRRISHRRLRIRSLSL